MKLLETHVLALFVVPAALAQPPEELYPASNPDSVIVETDRKEEELLDQVATEPEDLGVIDDLQWRQEHPFDLNKVTAEELETVPGVTPIEANAVISFREQFHRLASPRQLMAMEEIGEEVFQKLEPYVIVEGASNPSERMRVDLRTRASRDLQQRRGFLDSSYAGSSLKSYNRFVWSAPGVQAGGLFEKDPGEQTSNGFLSGYVAVRGLATLSQLIVGDYVVEAGQGLVLWRTSAFGKGAEISTARKSGLGATPYRSSDEFNFLRGITGTTVVSTGGGELMATAFLSRRSLDGSVDQQGDISGFYESGLFRTSSELKHRRVAREDLVGGRIRFVSAGDWNLGGTFYHSRFDRTIVADGPFDFKGASANLVGIDGGIQIQRLSAFGELARSGDRALALFIGGMLPFSQSVTAMVVYRDYSPRFNNFHAQGFGESDNTKNERGLYIGLRLRPVRWLSIAGYLDQFKFPWQTFENPLPSRGHDILLESSADLSQKLNLTLRYSVKSVETTEAATDPLLRETRQLVGRDQEKLRATMAFAIDRKIRLKGRLETTTVSFDGAHAKERGYLFYQDVRYTSLTGLSVEGRLIFFDTDSYESRVYEYENDVRGVFSNPALYGRGRRWYLLVRYNLFEMLTLSAKYQQTEKEDVLSIGSGDSEIPGNVDNRFAVQMDLQW